MNIHWIDWTILIVFTAFLVFMALITRKYSRSVADFLSANRLGGRYLLMMSNDMAGTAAIQVIAGFEMFYLAGFASQLWGLAGIPIALFLAVSGWIIYRYRQTRSMTIGQFFEMPGLRHHERG